MKKFYETKTELKRLNSPDRNRMCMSLHLVTIL